MNNFTNEPAAAGDKGPLKKVQDQQHELTKLMAKADAVVAKLSELALRPNR